MDVFIIFKDQTQIINGGDTMRIIDLNLRNACRLAEQHIAEYDYTRLEKIPDIETDEDFDKSVHKIFLYMKLRGY